MIVHFGPAINMYPLFFFHNVFFFKIRTSSHFNLLQRLVLKRLNNGIFFIQLKQLCSINYTTKLGFKMRMLNTNRKMKMKCFRVFDTANLYKEIQRLFSSFTHIREVNKHSRTRLTLPTIEKKNHFEIILKSLEVKVKQLVTSVILWEIIIIIK